MTSTAAAGWARALASVQTWGAVPLGADLGTDLGSGSTERFHLGADLGADLGSGPTAGAGAGAGADPPEAPPPGPGVPLVRSLHQSDSGLRRGPVDWVSTLFLNLPHPRP